MAGSRKFKVTREGQGDVFIEADEFRLGTVGKNSSAYAIFSDIELKGHRGEDITFNRHIEVALVQEPLTVEEIKCPDRSEELIEAYEARESVRQAAEHAVAKYGVRIRYSAVNKVILDTGCTYSQARVAVDAECARKEMAARVHVGRKVVATVTLDGGSRPDDRRESVEEHIREVVAHPWYDEMGTSITVEVV